MVMAETSFQVTQSQIEDTLKFIGYDPVKRKRELDEKLQMAFDSIRNLNIHLHVTSSSGNQKTRSSSNQKDIIMIQLQDIETEISELEKEVETFVSVGNGDNCFTKHYRTMYGHCEKLQLDLDSLEVCVSGREELRQQRKKAIIKIDELAKKLAANTHKDGRSCDKCEIKS